MTYPDHLLRQYCTLPNKSKDGYTSDETSTPLPLKSSTPIIHGSGLDPSTHGYHTGFQPHYVVAPMDVSTEDIRKIAEAIRDAVKDSLRKEFSKIIDEKIAPFTHE